MLAKSNSLAFLVLASAATALRAVAAPPPDVAAAGAPVGPEQSPPNAALEEIIVTAAKREQSINSVGLTITAATKDELVLRGVENVGDLNKIAPGFTATQSPYATPVYTLRGIGLYDYGFASAPSVAIYVDEVSLPYPLMQQGALLDVERVEILKGPQGTLFGQSSTGGAINYIAAKPTDVLAAGADLSFTNFGKIDSDGFVSGPISDTLRARASVRVEEGGAWQYSITRPNDENGSADRLFGRVILDWQPSDQTKFSFNFNAWRDRSESEAPQFVSNQLDIVGAPDARNPFAVVNPAGFAALTTPGSAAYDPSFAGRQNTVFNRAAAGEQGTLEYLGGPGGHGTVTQGNRAADWDPDFAPASDDHFYQVSVRGDMDLSAAVKLTSLTAFEHLDINRVVEGDGTDVEGLDEGLYGYTSAFSQELRLSGDASRLDWLVGGNYDHTRSSDSLIYHYTYISLNEPLPGLRFAGSDASSESWINEYAAFANGEFKATDHLTLMAGARFTQTNRRTDTCSSDNSAQQNLSKTFGNADGFDLQNVLRTALGLPLDPADHLVVGPGQCIVLINTVPVTDPHYLRPTLAPLSQHLDENNVSFRPGVNYKFDQGTLLYATVSRGYKAGIISAIGAAVTGQFVPARQEEVMAYEAGFKVPLFDHKLQFNGAAFYYDYSNKQVRSRVRDPVFGLLEILVNVPKSRIEGLEAELVARPVPGLDLSLSGTYLDSKVTSSFSSTPAGPVFNQEGYTGDFKGSPLPFTPKFSAVFDSQYQRTVTSHFDGFLGGTLTYQSRDNTTFYNAALPAPDFFRPSAALLDLRAGVASPSEGWRAYLFGRNVANRTYVTSYWQGTDVLVRYLGMPATYGIAFSYRYK